MDCLAQNAAEIERKREEGRGMDPERQRWREGDRDTERRIEIQ